MPEHRPMDEAYGRLSFRTGVLAGRVDAFLGSGDFLRATRAFGWDLTEEFYQQLRRLALEKGAEAAVVEAEALVDRVLADPATLPKLIEMQAEHDRRRSNADR